MNKYEFRRWVTYEEWYEVEARSEKEAREKLSNMGEDERQCQKYVGQDGEDELYRTTTLDLDEPEDREETEIGSHVEDKYVHVSSQDDIYAHD